MVGVAGPVLVRDGGRAGEGGVAHVMEVQLLHRQHWKKSHKWYSLVDAPMIQLGLTEMAKGSFTLACYGIFENACDVAQKQYVPTLATLQHCNTCTTTTLAALQLLQHCGTWSTATQKHWNTCSTEAHEALQHCNNFELLIFEDALKDFDRVGEHQENCPVQ